jgi:ABC-type nickel/cobalt efflux system permease component RcnA
VAAACFRYTLLNRWANRWDFEAGLWLNGSTQYFSSQGFTMKLFAAVLILTATPIFGFATPAAAAQSETSQASSHARHHKHHASKAHGRHRHHGGAKRHAHTQTQQPQ